MSYLLDAARLDLDVVALPDGFELPAASQQPVELRDEMVFSEIPPHRLWCVACRIDADGEHPNAVGPWPEASHRRIQIAGDYRADVAAARVQERDKDEPPAERRGANERPVLIAERK